MTRAYLEGRYHRPYTVYTADEDAEYEATYVIDLSEIRPVGRHAPPARKRDARRGGGRARH